MAIPPFSVMGIEGACGRIHCTLGSCDHSILATGSQPWPKSIHAVIIRSQRDEHKKVIFRTMEIVIVIERGACVSSQILLASEK